MKRFAVIENDLVVNVIAADTLTIAKKATGLECIETDGSPWINWSRVNGEWIAPVVPEVVDDTEAV